MTTSPSTPIEITVDQLKSYLLHHQWYLDGDIRNIATIWHRHQDITAEIILPQPTARDFQQRLRDAINSIALYEKRDPSELLRDIKGLFTDVVTVRVVHADTKGGTIPISDGVLLIAKAKELLSAAAQSIFSKRKHYTGKAPKEAKDYLETLLLGQTEIGSYVVNVIVPFLNNSTHTPTPTDATPIAQAVTLNLLASLQALTKANKAYEEKGDLTVFDEAVLSGVSANLCDALLGFSGTNNNRAFEVTITAAPNPLFKHESKKFEFGASQVELLKKASGYYKEDYMLPQRKITGHIIKLSRSKEEIAGTIILEAKVNDIVRKIKVTLADNDYHQAVMAHDRENLVQIEGDIWIKARATELLNPRNFSVIIFNNLF